MGHQGDEKATFYVHRREYDMGIQSDVGESRWKLVGNSARRTGKWYNKLIRAKVPLKFEITWCLRNYNNSST